MDGTTRFTEDTVLTAKRERSTAVLQVAQQSSVENEALGDPVFTAPEGMRGSPTVTYARTVTYTDEHNEEQTKTYTSFAKPTTPGSYTVTVQCDTFEAAYVGSADFVILKAGSGSGFITVTGGSASAVAADPGDTVTVTADVPEGYVFDHWTGSENVEFADETAKETTFTMPNGDVSVAASFKKCGIEAEVAGGTLSYTVTAPEGAWLIPVTYKVGKFVSMDIVTVGSDSIGFTGSVDVAAGSDYTYKLMLVDGESCAPLCLPWKR